MKSTERAEITTQEVTHMRQGAVTALNTAQGGEKVGTMEPQWKQKHLRKYAGK